MATATQTQMAGIVDVGQQAPDFTLSGTTERPVTLSEVTREKGAILVFYRLDFTGGWAEELSRFRDKAQELRSAGYEVFGISVDSPFAHREFAAKHEINFPLLSDFNREVGRKYGLLRDIPAYLLRDVCKRAVFVIDRGGTVRHKWVESEGDELPDVNQVLQAVRKGS